MAKHYRYFFDRAFGSVPQSKVRECRSRLVEAISPGRNGTFYVYLANGIRDIRLPLYEEITAILVSYGIPKQNVWHIETEE